MDLGIGNSIQLMRELLGNSDYCDGITAPNNGIQCDNNNGVLSKSLIWDTLNVIGLRCALC